MKKIISSIVSNACIILLAATACQSQPTGQYEHVMPGSDLLNPSKVTTHAVRYMNKKMSMEYRMWEVENDDGREMFYLAIRFGNAEHSDTILFDRKDFSYAGRRLINASDGYEMIVDVQAGKMRASLSALPESNWKRVGDYTQTYEHGLFEIAVLNYSIKMLTLSEGLKLSLPVFLFKDDFPVHWVDVIVDGKETLKIDGKTYETWKVMALGGDQGDKTFWISDEHPYALKIQSKGRRAWTFGGMIK